MSRNFDRFNGIIPSALFPRRTNGSWPDDRRRRTSAPIASARINMYTRASLSRIYELIYKLLGKIGWSRARARAKLRNSDGNFAVWRQLRVSACVNTLLRRACCEQCDEHLHTRTFIAILSCPFDYARPMFPLSLTIVYRFALSTAARSQGRSPPPPPPCQTFIICRAYCELIGEEKYAGPSRVRHRRV